MIVDLVRNGVGTDATEDSRLATIWFDSRDPAVSAALANAVFDATGARLRQVPFTPERVKAALEVAGDGLAHRSDRGDRDRQEVERHRHSQPVKISAAERLAVLEHERVGADHHDDVTGVLNQRFEALRRGPRSWNVWRAQNPSTIPNLTGIALSVGERQMGPISGGPAGNPAGTGAPGSRFRFAH